MIKRTRKYVKALEVGSNFSHATSDELYQHLMETGWYWDANFGSWRKAADQNNDPPSTHGKGIDDVIASGNFNNVTEINYKTWAKTLEKQFGSSENNGTKNKDKQKKHDGLFASQIAENYRDKLAWDSEGSRWMMYGYKNNGTWSEVHSDYVNGLIISHLETQDEPYTARKLNSVSAILRKKLAVLEWENPS